MGTSLHASNRMRPFYFPTFVAEVVHCGRKGRLLKINKEEYRAHPRNSAVLKVPASLAEVALSSCRSGWLGINKMGLRFLKGKGTTRMAKGCVP
eukprot:1152442-Pelagomonas_calceolata.AAC.2